jgi:hypothetical protein
LVESDLANTMKIQTTLFRAATEHPAVMTGSGRTRNTTNRRDWVLPIITVIFPYDVEVVVIDQVLSDSSGSDVEILVRDVDGAETDIVGVRKSLIRPFKAVHHTIGSILAEA